MSAYSIPPQRLLALLTRRAAYEYLEAELAPEQHKHLVTHRQHWLEGLDVQELDALAPAMPEHSTCTADTLLEHADHVEHTAALGGYVHPVSGERRTLTQAEREQWAQSAAALREAAHIAAADAED